MPSTSQRSSPARQTNFLDLPPEIRNEIYALALSQLPRHPLAPGNPPAFLDSHPSIRADAMTIYFYRSRFVLNLIPGTGRSQALAWLASLGNSTMYLRDVTFQYRDARSHRICPMLWATGNRALVHLALRVRLPNVRREEDVTRGGGMESRRASAEAVAVVRDRIGREAGQRRDGSPMLDVESWRGIVEYLHGLRNAFVQRWDDSDDDDDEEEESDDEDSNGTDEEDEDEDEDGYQRSHDGDDGTSRTGQLLA